MNNDTVFRYSYSAKQNEEVQAIRDVKADYKTLFFRSAVHSVAKLWYENGCIESVEKMGELITREISK